MQRTPFSIYNTYYQSALRVINARCHLSHPTAIPPRPIRLPAPEPSLCVSGRHYNVLAENNAEITKDMSKSVESKDGKNGKEPTVCDCEAVVLAHNVSSAVLYMANSLLLPSCSTGSALPAGASLCLPLPCARIHILRRKETTCLEVEMTQGMRPASLRQFNPWINLQCTNLVDGSNILERVLCLSPQGIEAETRRERDRAHGGDEGATSHTGLLSKVGQHVQKVLGGKSHDEL